VAHLYQALNPAVLKMIKMTLEAAQRNQIEVIMCGEMAGDPVNIPVLLGFGIRHLSMNPASIPVIKKMVRDIDMEKAQELPEALFRFSTVEEITRFIQEAFKEILPYRETEN
jgi:phosphotransferase system enzyme I (PtsI)